MAELQAKEDFLIKNHRNLTQLGMKKVDKISMRFHETGINRAPIVQPAIWL